MQIKALFILLTLIIAWPTMAGNCSSVPAGIDSGLTDEVMILVLWINSSNNPCDLSLTICSYPGLDWQIADLSPELCSVPFDGSAGEATYLEQLNYSKRLLRRPPPPSGSGLACNPIPPFLRARHFDEDNNYGEEEQPSPTES